MDIKSYDANITCFILDDEQDAIDRLEILINKISVLEVLGKETDPERAVLSMPYLKPEVVFMDIVMAKKNQGLK